MCSYTPGIYADGYIVFAFPFVRSSVRMFVSYTPGIYADGYIVFAFPFVRSYVRLFVRSFVR